MVAFPPAPQTIQRGRGRQQVCRKSWIGRRGRGEASGMPKQATRESS